MTVTTKIAIVFVLLIVAAPVAFFLGCGSPSDNCGGCPADSIPPTGSTFEVVTDMTDETIPTLGGAGATGTGCINNLTFVLKDPNDVPMNDICVEVFTNGFIKPSATQGDCTVSTGYVASYFRTRTDAGGTITVDFSSGTLTCAGSTDETYSVFVQVNACTAGAVSQATWTLQCS